MLRIHQNSSAAGAKAYYTHGAGEYYLDGQELCGVWRGKAARKLGLTGEIQQADWDAICEQVNPKTGEKLFQRRKENATNGYDFTWNPPKSVSILYGLTQDERILTAFRESVDATMRDIEAEMKTRVRKGGRNEDRVSGNMLWGEFIHLTSRPVDEKVDPQLHAHCYVVNACFDQAENRWKAGQFRDIKRDAPYFEALFHARLSRRLVELGLPVERTRSGWEVAGVGRSLVETFSRRTALIEEKARELGVDDAAAKAELGARTRSRKVKALTMPELRAEWRGRMSEQELASIERLDKSIGGKALAADGRAAELAVQYAIGHSFERRSVIPERKVLATALRQAVGRATPEQVIRQADRSGLIVGERDGQRMATTREVLNEEIALLDWARSTRGTMPQLGKPGRAFTRKWLNDSQRLGVRHVLESRDRVILLRGAAGVGKTSLMQETVEAIRENGGRVVALAPTAEAGRGVLRAEGFKDAETVARLLTDRAFQQRAKNSVWWVDEAGLLGAKTMRQVFDLAEKLDARVLLTGDKRQNPSVERGSVLQLLESEAGIRPAEVREIQRQKDEYKQAVKALSDGKTAEGLKRLDKLGWIREIAGEEERYRQLATDYVDSLAEGKRCLAVCPTHREGERVTTEIRRVLKERGRLGRDSRIVRVLQNANLTEAQRGDALNYVASDVIQFHRNAKGYRAGQRVTAGNGDLPLDQAKRFTVFRARDLELAAGDTVRITHNGWTADRKHRLNNGSLYRVTSFDECGGIVLDNGWVVARDFGHLAHGFCVTAYAAQGKTVDRVYVAQGTVSVPATSRESFYVACSRAREALRVYCGDKQELRDAVTQSEERLTATDLMRRAREVVALHRRQAELYREHEPQRDKEPVHER